MDQTKLEKNLSKRLDTKELSINTKRLYINNIKKLYRDLEIKSNSIIALAINYDKIIKYINNLSTPSTKRSYLSSIVSLIELNKRIPLTIKKDYINLRNHYTDVYNSDRLDNIQVKPSLTYNELLDIPDKIKDIIFNKFKSIYLTKDELNKLSIKNKILYIKTLSDYIFLLVHINQPLRLDYYNLKLIHYTDVNNYKDHNLIVIYDDGTIKLFLNKYKTSKLYGTIIREFDKKLSNELHKWFNEFKIIMDKDPEYLLYRYDPQSKLSIFKTKSQFSKYISKLLKKYTNLNLTNNDIRKAVETAYISDTEYQKKSNKENEAFSNQLLHSHNTARISYNKIKN